MIALLTLTLLISTAHAWAENDAEPAPTVTADAAEALGEGDAGEASSDGAEGEDEAAQDDDAPRPAPGYVLVSTATQSGWLPLPFEGEYDYSLKQTLSDGSEAVNVIHLTPDSVCMEDSTCENHDCVQQGTVSLENREDRILGNMIICLPNQVFLQLYTPEEVLALVQSQQAEAGDDSPTE